MKNQKTKHQILNTKSSKGITLVALIITIIVLLILAVVAISAVNNTGIIQHAQNSADEYTDGRDKENTTLGNYIDVLNHYKPTEDNTNPPDPEPEEILWAFVDWGDEDYSLCFIGNVDELDLSQDKEVKAYVANDIDDNTRTPIYPAEKQITTVKLSDMGTIGLEVENTSMQKLILGPEIYSNFEEFNGINVKTIILKEGITSISKEQFAGSDYIETIEIPSSVTSIGNRAFYKCTNLTSITIKQAEGSLDLSGTGLTEAQIASVVWAPET